MKIEVRSFFLNDAIIFLMRKKDFVPAYLKSYQEGTLFTKIESGRKMLKKCSVCPRNCLVDRTKDQTGFCRSGYLPVISSFSPHFGEERPLVGSHGSGTIFFTNCNLGCVFCQNYSISHRGEGEEVTFSYLSRIMLRLQNLGCHNINFVSPTHFVPQILIALPDAIKGGLFVPLVYNTGGYDSPETLRLLDGIIDIYMPDFKYTDKKTAKKYSLAEDYPEIVRTALKIMHDQAGDLVLDESGIALRGLLVRHLVLPEELAGTGEAMRFLASEISLNTYVNIMSQYYPCGDIPPGSPLNRRISAGEYQDALDEAKKAGLTRLD